jgi:hypothetical protein
VLGAIDAMGLSDDTLVVYIFGDNGASLEGTETGSFNELTALNGLPLTPAQQLEAIHAYGGLEVWGGPRTDPHYAAAWALAGNTPFQWGKQVASHLGGTRNGMVVSWPKRITDRGGGGTQRLFVAGKQVAEGKLEHTVPLRFSGYAGLDVGRDNGLPVSPGKVYYLRAPFPFAGTIEKVVFDVQ